MSEPTFAEKLFGDQADSPAAPEGLKQEATAAKGVAGGDPTFAESLFGQQALAQGEANTSQKWFTGANYASLQNGWDTTFEDKYQTNWMKALENGTAQKYFEQRDATGVVTYDHKSSDGTKEFKFGDVYEDGRLKGNVYKDFDKDTANLLMAPRILGDEEQAHLYSSSEYRREAADFQDALRPANFGEDPAVKEADRLAQAEAKQGLAPGGDAYLKSLDWQIDQKRQENNAAIPEWLHSAEFQRKVAEQAKDLSSNVAVRGAVDAGGAAGAAALARTVASAVPNPIAKGVLYLGAAAIGAFAADENRDEINEQIARASVITQMAGDTQNGWAQATTWLSEWSGIAQRVLLNPVNNLVHGTYDATHGTVGDAVSQFRKDQQEGKLGAVWQTADLAAMVADGALTFGNPSGLAIYTTTMQGQIGGQVGTLIATGGKQFDYQSAKFDNIFTDKDGNFDALSAAAGIGNIGIDVVQLGMARGLAAKATNQAAAAGLGAEQGYGYGRSLLQRVAGETIPKKFADLGATKVEHLAGRKFFVNGADEAVGVKRSLAFLAPSENIAGVWAQGAARVAARTARKDAASGGAATVDDFYRSATMLAKGDRKLNTILVNAFGEGTEELLQAVFEPVSHEHTPTMDDIARSFFSGAAMGAGMGMGLAYRSISGKQKMEAQSQAVFHTLYPGATDEEFRKFWGGLSESERSQFHTGSRLIQETAKGAKEKLTRDWARTQSLGAPGVEWRNDMIQSVWDMQLAKSTLRTDQGFVVTQSKATGEFDQNGALTPNSVPSNAVETSAMSFLRAIDSRSRGLQVQLDWTTEQRTNLATELAGLAPESARAQEIAQLDGELAATEATLSRAVELAPALLAHLQERVAAIMDTDPNTNESLGFTDQQRELETLKLNDLVRELYYGQATELAGYQLTPEDQQALMYAVTSVMTRYPQDQAGSYVAVMPQVAWDLSVNQADTNMRVSTALLKGISGDFDGDQMYKQDQLVLRDTTFKALRSGLNLFGQGKGPSIADEHFAETEVELVAAAYASTDPTVTGLAAAFIDGVEQSLLQRYAWMPAAELAPIIDTLRDEVSAPNVKALSNFRDALWLRFGEQIYNHGTDNGLTNEPMWVHQMVLIHLQRFQRGYADRDWGQAPLDTDVALPFPQQSGDPFRIFQLPAATPGITAALRAGGATMFRTFQKLHYSVIREPIDVADKELRDDIESIARMYEALSSLMVESKVDEMTGKDDIVRRVQAQIEAVVVGAAQEMQVDGFAALPIVANMLVRDVEIDEATGQERLGEPITLAQALLRRSLDKWRRDNDIIWDREPALQSRYNAVLEMTLPSNPDAPVRAESAFLEVFGDYQTQDLLGDASTRFGRVRSLNQLVREFASLPREKRADLERSMRMDEAYLAESDGALHTAPYSLKEIGGISAYKAMLDAVIAVARHRPNELAARNERASNDFQEMWKQFRQAIHIWSEANRVKETDTELAARFFVEHPQFAGQAMRLLPRSIATAVTDVNEDGEVLFESWFLDIFTAETAAKAEMILMRNVMMKRWFSTGAHEGAESREWDRLVSTWHRLFYRLLSPATGGSQLQFVKFMDALVKAEDPKDFVEWVNGPTGVNANQVPLMLWIDDVAEFDKDKTGGGWQSNMASAEMREALRTLKASSERLVTEVDAEVQVWKTDQQLLSELNDIDKRLANGELETNINPTYLGMYRRMQQVLERATEGQLGIGPNAAFFEMVGAIMSFNGSSHTKGQAASNVVTFGNLETMRDAMGRVTNYERIMGALHSQGMTAASTYLGEFAKSSQRVMTDEGRTVEWPKPTMAAMIELLQNSKTRSMAREMLFPSVLERNAAGTTSKQFTLGRSLKGLLDNSSNLDLFNRTETKGPGEVTGQHGRLSYERAAKFRSYLDTLVRSKFGGGFALSVLFNDVALAKTSAMSSLASQGSAEALASNTTIQLSEALQELGAITDPDVLERMKASLKDKLYSRFASRRLKIDGVTNAAEIEQTRDVWIEQLNFEGDLEIERIESELDPTKDAAFNDAIIDRVRASRASYAARVQRIKDVLDANFMATLEAQFLLPADTNSSWLQFVSAGVTDAQKAIIQSYVIGNLTFASRMKQVAPIVDKVRRYMERTDRTVDIAPIEYGDWRKLGMAIIGLQMDEVFSTGAKHLGVPSYADPKNRDKMTDAHTLHRDFSRYWDPTFSYVLDELLDFDGPILQAAREARLRALGPGAVGVSESNLQETLLNTVLHGFGDWTSDVPRISIEASERLYSAAAEAGISVPGNLPKRQAALIGATTRTFRLDGIEDALSTATLTGAQLHGDEFDDSLSISLTPGAAAVQRPLIQLNNRFVKSVMVQVDPSQPAVDLLATSPLELGQVWPHNPAIANSGYQVINLNRLRAALDRFAIDNGVDVNNIVINMELFHPEARPADETWYHNIVFEGVAFEQFGDFQTSLLGTLWFNADAMNQLVQRQSLDATKTGEPAFRIIPAPTFEEVQKLEAAWDLDLAAVIRAKTRILIETDFGGVTLSPEMYNAVYKDVEIRHYAVSDGKLLTANDIIAMQNAGTFSTEHPNATLWIPSDEVLRTLFGEPGDQGVLNTDDTYGPIQAIPNFTGVKGQMPRGLFAGETAELQNTRLAARMPVGQISVRPHLPKSLRAAYDLRVTYLARIQDEGYNDRAQTRNDRKTSPEQSRADVRKIFEPYLRAEDLSVAWPSSSISFVAPRNILDSQLAVRTLAERDALLQANDLSRGWILRDVRDPAKEQSVVTLTTLEDGNLKQGDRVLPKDIVGVDVSSFYKYGGEDAEANLERALRHLVDRGATVVLGESGGTSERTADAASYMQTLGYERVNHSARVYQAPEYGSWYQNQRARASSLMETRTVSARNRVAVFLVPGVNLDENAAAVVNPKAGSLQAVAVKVSLLPVDVFHDFHLLRTSARGDEMEQAKQQLRSLLGAEITNTVDENSDGYKLLLKQHGEQEAEPSLLVSLNQMLARDGLYPKAGDDFGVGTILPLAGPNGKLLLYRHGFKTPSRSDIEKMFATPLTEGTREPSRIGIYRSEIEPAATVYTGTLVGMDTRSKFGMQVELSVPLSVFGQKLQLEWNGMKYVLTGFDPDMVPLPEHGFFHNGKQLDLVSDLASAVSKESFGDWVNNPRNAIAFFGMDFTDVVAKVFWPNEDPSTKSQDVVNLLSHFAAQDTLSVEAAKNMVDSLSPGQFLRDMLSSLPVELGIDTATLGNVGDQSAAETKIVLAMLAYLMTPGGISRGGSRDKIKHVLRSGGFNNIESNTDPDAYSVLMPDLFTRVFYGEDTHEWLIKQLNRQLYKPNAGKDGTGYKLHSDWTFETIAPPKQNSPTQELRRTRGYLQFAEAYAAGDNPVTDEQAFKPTTKQGVSKHAMMSAFSSMGAFTAYNGDMTRAAAYSSGVNVPSIEKAGFEAVWSRFTSLPEGDSATQSWRDLTRPELERRSSARVLRAAFYHTLDVDKKDLWSDREKQTYADLKTTFGQVFGLAPSQTYVLDHLVRMAAYAPVGTNTQGEELGNVAGTVANHLAQEIIENGKMGMQPLYSMPIPLPPFDIMWMIFDANKNAINGWRMFDGVGKDRKAIDAKDFSGWVDTIIGSLALDDSTVFDPLALLATDGMMHTYQDSTETLSGNPVSLDALVASGLLKSDRLLSSLSPNRDLLDQGGINLNPNGSTLQEVLDGNHIAGQYRSLKKNRHPEAHSIEKMRQRRDKWRKEIGAPRPVDVTMRRFRVRGEEYTHEVSNANSIWHMAFNLRLGTALINPGLWIGAPIENFLRTTIDNIANILSLQATGKVGVGQAKLTELIRGTKTGAVLERLGLEATYSTEELEKIGTTVGILGERSDFKQLIYGDLMYLKPWMGHGKLSKALAMYARFGTFFQDPYWGMRANTIARKYMEGALSHYRYSDQAMTTSELAAALATNPQYLQKRDPAAHAAGIAAVGQIRSMKQSPLAKAIQGVLNPMAESSGFVRNTAGNLMKLQFPFIRYTTNFLTTFTGLQGVSDLIAMHYNGRDKGFIAKMALRVAGADEAAMNTPYDMSDVLEGLDYTRSFIRSGVTLSGVFMASMVFGGLGLSGEDEEQKKRRRLSRAQGVPMTYDPRDLQNDFRNSDAAWLDNLSFIPGVEQLSQVIGGNKHIIAQLPWTVTQFSNPIIGFEKFQETGDPKQILWGFESALHGMPLVNTTLWNDAVETFSTMMGNEDENLGDAPRSYQEGSMAWAIKAVGVLEKQLFENSFLSAVYVMADEFDRDPYAMELTDSDGTTQVDASGNPRPTDALQDYRDAEGNVRQGYISRGGLSAQIHSLTENRAVLGSFLSLFDGGMDSDFLRYNMVPKTRSLEVPPIDQNTGEAFVIDALGQTGGAQLTAEEAKQIARNAAIKQLGDQGQYLANAKLEPYVMSLLQEHDGREILTKDGARAVFSGLQGGLLKPEDAALKGVHISLDMRRDIQAEWGSEVIQQGINWGLTQDQATKRWERIFYGHSVSDPEAVGLKDILWSDKIPYSDTREYNQLNTTYITGPDGRPMATGVARANLLAIVGLSPTGYYGADNSKMGTDGRLNSTDLVSNVNTGLRGLVPIAPPVPTDVEIGKAVEDAIKASNSKSYTPQATNSLPSSGGGGYKSGGGGGGGYGGGRSPYYVTTPYYSKVDEPGGARGGGGGFGDNIPFLNVPNPLLRRASIRRERVSSERGRLKQWQ